MLGHSALKWAALAASRGSARQAACWALLGAWGVGVAAGFVQVARGAHFLSHVLWTAWVAWTVALMLAMGTARKSR